MAKTGGLHELRGSSGVGVRVYRCWVRLPVIWKLAPAAVEVPPPLTDADKSQCAPNPDAGVFLTSSYGLRRLSHPGTTLFFLPQQRNNYVVITTEVGHVCTCLFHINPSCGNYI